ncbi:MAG: nascent polypeptide-associated complex protein [Candidatus Woesearchaeota archaeon]
MMPNLNPAMMRQAMKRMGIQQEDMEATEVIIKTKNGDYAVKDPEVMKIKMSGQESLQITGKIEKLSTIKEEDIELVAEQAKCTKEEARTALEETKGDMAEAILKLQS